MPRAFPSRAAMIGGVGLAIAGLFVPTVPALARVFIGVGIPFYPPPVYYPPPPVFYPPPVYYAPPIQYTPPVPAYTPAPSGRQTCYAGAYTCPMDRPTTAGASCYCLGNGGTRVWGRAN